MAAGFEIDGERYEIPTLDTITLDEERVLFLHADTVLSDFAPASPDAEEEVKRAHDLALLQRVRNPAFKGALAYIAYKRKHPEAEPSEIGKIVGGLGALNLDLALLEGEDESPPAQSSPSEPQNRSEPEEPTRQSDSGSPTGSDLVRVVVTPENTGTSESDTSSPGAPRIELVS